MRPNNALKLTALSAPPRLHWRRRFVLAVARTAPQLSAVFDVHEGGPMLREVTLAGLAAGRLLLHSIPGQREALEALWAEAKREKLDAIVRLTEMHETR